MPSVARKAFDNNVKDIEGLLALHTEKGGVSKGRRYGLEVLNKSAIVLITAYWEAYCEDLAAEALESVVAHAAAASDLPKALRKQIANELKSDLHELAIWQLAGEGWKTVLSTRLVQLREDRNRSLNSPNSGNIDKLFLSALGIPRVSDSWKWATKMTVDRARRKLNAYVTLRGSVAHRGKASASVTKAHVDDYFQFVRHLAGKTGGTVNNHVLQVTGTRLWE